MFNHTIHGGFDIHDSRKKGWTITIELERPDPDGVKTIQLELDANDPYAAPHHGREPAVIYWIRQPDEWNEWSYHDGVKHGPHHTKYHTVLGVLPARDADLSQLSPVICVRKFLVLANPDENVTHIFEVPIASVCADYVDFGL